MSRVLTATNADEAERLLADPELEVDGVFLDIRMPGKSGVAFAQELALGERPCPSCS